MLGCVETQGVVAALMLTMEKTSVNIDTLDVRDLVSALGFGSFLGVLECFYVFL